MTGEEGVFESRRARREALRAAESSPEVVESSYSSAELPSRRELRRLAQETGVVPTITPEMLRDAAGEQSSTAVFRDETWAPDLSPLTTLAAHYEQILTSGVSSLVDERETPATKPALEGDWRDQLTDEAEHGWVENHSTEIGVMQSPALKTLVVDSYHTGDISGPLNSTGEIFVTGQILIEHITDDTTAVAVPAGLDVNQPAIPRRASEALSIIGKTVAPEKYKRIPSVGSAVVAGLATALGTLALAIAALAYFTDII